MVLLSVKARGYLISYSTYSFMIRSGQWHDMLNWMPLGAGGRRSRRDVRLHTTHSFAHHQNVPEG